MIAITILLTLAAGNATTPRATYQVVRTGQILAQLQAPGAGRYQVCADVEKPAGRWAMRLEISERGVQRHRLYFSAWGPVALQCQTLDLRAGDVVTLVSAGRLQGRTTALVELADSGP
jgi:hypothetical protein